MKGDPQRNELQLLQQLNKKHANERNLDPNLLSRIQSYELAYRMQAAAPEAVNINQETQMTLDAYGIGKKPTDE